jgi:hypothetical protein
MSKKNRRINKRIKPKKEVDFSKTKERVSSLFMKSSAGLKTIFIAVSPIIICNFSKAKRYITECISSSYRYIRALKIEKKIIPFALLILAWLKKFSQTFFKVSRILFSKISSKKTYSGIKNHLKFNQNSDQETDQYSEYDNNEFDEEAMDEISKSDSEFKNNDLFSSMTASFDNNVRKISLKNTIEYFNPRTVRLEAPRRHFIHTSIISIFFIFLSIAVGAVASGADKGVELLNTGSDSVPEVDNSNYDFDNVEQTLTRDDNDSTISEKIIDDTTEEEITETVKKARPSNFHNPLYVFTNEPVKSHTAYPLANPPGIVVTIAGAPTPEESPVDMVGKDSRIKSIKRIHSKSGLRYIIWLKNPIKKIETSNEGNVISISPLK